MLLQAGTEVTDRVVLTEPLGEGAMGAVWKAHHRTLLTDVAVKFISEESATGRPDAAERFAMEAAAAAQIKSPHVVQMIDHGVTKDGGTPYIVMELLEGESLEERIDREGTLPLEDTADILTQVARALDAAHRIGVIHRDIKPHNIFLTHIHGETFVKVLDFGIAKQTRVASGKEITEPGMIVGTPQYVSRDLIMGSDMRIDPQVDLWSLSVVAYKCLTGTLPFDGDSIGAICAALATAVFEPPSRRKEALPPRVDAWFRRAFAENPADRFASAGELAASFRALLSDDMLDTPPASTMPPPSPARRRWLGAALAAIGVTIGAALAVSALSTASQSPNDAAASAGEDPSEAPSAASVHAVSTTRAAVPPSASAPATTSAPTPSARAEGPARDGDFIAIPAGTVHMGCFEERDRECADDEKPSRVVSVDAFWIDRTEVTVLAYAQCVMAGYCSDRRLEGYALEGGPYVRSKMCNWRAYRRELHPINCVSYEQAKSFCEWRGARLPTEAEWERAARGDDRRLFPWGDEPASCVHTVMADEGDEGCGRGGTWPVAKKPRDQSPFGVLDLAGNVREWVSDWYGEDYYLTGRRENPPGPNRGVERVARGGSWGNEPPRFLRTSARDALDPSTRSVYVGFRCALSAGATDFE